MIRTSLINPLVTSRHAALNVLDYGADPRAGVSATARFARAFGDAVDQGRTLFTPAGLYLFSTQLVVPAGLKWTLDPNAILIKNFTASAGDRYNNCLIRNENCPTGATIVNHATGWTASTFDDGIEITGGRIRHASSLMVGGGVYMIGVSNMKLSRMVVEHPRGDWGFTVAGDDIVLDRVRVEVPEADAAVLEDGIHVLQGNRITIIEPWIQAGDDAISFGANYNTGISDVEVRGGTLTSWKAHALSFYQYRTGITSAFAPPITKLQNIRIQGVKARSGILRNGLIYGTLDYVLGTAQAGASSTITLASTASAADDFYNGCKITTTGGTGSGQVGTITDYVGSTKVATVSPAWGVTPDATTTYSIAGAYLQNLHISDSEFVGGDQSGHDGTLPNGIKLINAKDVHFSNFEVRNSIRDSFYFEDIVGKLVLNDISNTDPQSTNTTFYALRLLRCPDVVTHGGSLTRSGTQVARVEDSNLVVNGTELSGMGNTIAAFRLLNTSGKTTQLTANGAKFVRALGATTSRAVQNDGTGCSYALNNCDFTQCDVMVVDNAAPTFGVIRGAIPASLQTVTATASDATPSVRGANVLVTANASATAITDLDDGYEGQVVTVVIADANTTVDFTGTNLKGNSGLDWSPASGDSMVCTRRGSSWYCDVSSSNTTTAMGAGVIELGHNSDTTIARSGAGAVTVEGVTVALNTTFQTHTAGTFNVSNADTTISRASAGHIAVEGVDVPLNAITEPHVALTLDLGHASDTTISRASAGHIAVEGVGVPLNSITDTHTAQALEMGHASDTTIARASAGHITVEGVAVALNTTSEGMTTASLELGNASDTTITRSSAGVIAVEGVTVPLNSTSAVHTASTIELGAASDTTVSRASAGDIAVEGNIVYRAGGTDVPVTDGGTGVSTLTTAYGLLAAGTVATGAVQTLPVGTAGQVLISGGAGALPAYTASPTFTAPTLGTPASGDLSACTAVTTATASKIAQRDASANLLADNHISSATDTATAAGTLTMTIDSTQVQTFSGSTTHTVKLPTTSVVAGQTYRFVNLSSGTVSIQASDASALLSLIGNRSVEFAATINTPVSNADWYIVGTRALTTASATSMALRDSSANLTANNWIATRTQTASAAGTLTMTIASAQTQEITGSTTHTVRLPTTSVVAGQEYVIVNNSSGSVTVQSSGANTISTLTTIQMGVYRAQKDAPTAAADWKAIFAA